MKTKFLLCLFVCLFFSSCQKSSHKSSQKSEETNVSVLSTVDKPIEVNIDLNNDCLPFDSLMSYISYVKLETTGENLIGGISQLLFVSDKIVVVDARYSKTITVCDKKGHYLNKIGALGQGPQEYAYLAHVSLSPDNTMIVVTDMGSGQFKYYNLDGQYLKSVKFPYWFSNCEFITDNLIAGYYSGGNNLSGTDVSYKPLLVVTDLMGNVSYSAFQSYYKKDFSSTILEPLRKFEDRVLYNNPNTDSIYLLTPHGLDLCYHLNVKGARPIVQNENITDKLLDEQHQNNPFFNGDFIELKDGSIFHIFELGKGYYRFGIYSNNKQCVSTCSGAYYNPFFCFFMDAPKARYEENTVVIDNRADIVLSYKNELYRLGKKEEIDELYEDLTEDSNPVLFFYELKF